MDKQEIRKYYIKMLKEQNQVVIKDIDIDNYSLILAYIPMKSEVDTVPLIDKALEKGIKVAVPSSDYRFFSILDKNWKNRLIKLENGTFGICNTELLDIFQINEKTLVLVPGLAFSSDGKRLGSGSGFYDKVIEILENRGDTDIKDTDIKGVCTPFQISQNIPVEPHDRKVKDLIIC